MFFSHGAPVRIACALLALTALYNFYYGFAGYFRYDPGVSKVALDHDSLFLNREQCEARFPLLGKEIDDAVAASGKFVFNRTTEGWMGQVHGRIKDGKVGVLYSTG